jgi:hypothetical protein
MTTIARSSMNVFAHATYEALKIKYSAKACQKTVDLELKARSALHAAGQSTIAAFGKFSDGLKAVQNHAPSIMRPTLDKVSLISSKAQGYSHAALSESEALAKEAELEAAHAVFEEVAAKKAEDFSKKGFLTSMAFETVQKIELTRFPLPTLRIPKGLRLPKIELDLPALNFASFKVPKIPYQTLEEAQQVAAEVGLSAVELSMDAASMGADAALFAKEAHKEAATKILHAANALPEPIRAKIPSILKMAEDKAVDEASRASTDQLKKTFEEREKQELEALKAGTTQALRPVLGDDTDRVVAAGSVIAEHYTSHIRSRFNLCVREAFELLRSLLQSIFRFILSLIRPPSA